MVEEIDDQKQSDERERVQPLSLSELLPLERIRLNVIVSHWQEAIQEAGKLLYNTGAVSEEYIDAMVQVAQELGPYIVIAPGIAIPHASTKAGAKQTALSLIKLETPIAFGNPDNDPVRLVFALSAVDQKVHIMALQTLAEIFMAKELVEQLMNAESTDAVIRIIHQTEEIVERNE